MAGQYCARIQLTVGVLMKLYFAENACSFAPHIVLQELALPYELVRVNNQTKHTSEGSDFLSINAKGYVAALQLDTDEILTEGPVLLQYLADLKPERGLIPVHGSWARLRLQEWLNFIATELHAGAAPLFNQTLAHEAQEIFKERLFKRFDLLQRALMNTEYLSGRCFTIVDAYLFTILQWMPGFAIELQHWPLLERYQQRIGKRPSVIAARQHEAVIPMVM